MTGDAGICDSTHLFSRQNKRDLLPQISFAGAGDEARTRYLHLGKVALYRMSYTRINPSGTGHISEGCLVPPVGIEPTTRGFSVRCSTY